MYVYSRVEAGDSLKLKEEESKWQEEMELIATVCTFS
jgi:hypothetical protein